MAIKIAISDEDHDGICIATATRDGQPWVRFETTQAEFNVWARKIGGVSILQALIDEAKSEEKRREALGRTWFEETLVNVSFTIPAGELKA
jgi:hypothetical protein